METVIDWSKAPEGFPLWLEGTNEDHRKNSGWYRDAGQVFEGAYGGQWRACREGQFFTVHRNPGSTTWTGEGLPPVGTVCAVLNSDLGNPTWERCTILYSGKHRVVYDSESCEERVAFIENLKFRQGRPIRTPEQIAAEEREAKIQEVFRVLSAADNDMCGRPCLSSMAEALVVAGYRKQADPCKP